ncbi:uncharacterized protein LOC142233536 [Haematobia irritans]|uniref:uncharacterized protein LOC142233536 n=1 Tax=Haematobia irritans TaxID=7368 RepID=UPI003F4FFF70
MEEENPKPMIVDGQLEELEFQNLVEQVEKEVRYSPCNDPTSICAFNKNFWLRAIELVEQEPSLSDNTYEFFNVRRIANKSYDNVEVQLRKEFENLPRQKFLARKLANIRRNAIRSHQKMGEKSRNPYVPYTLR